MKIRSTKIVEARLEEGLSQAYLAKHIGTSQPSLSRVEHGKTLIAQSTEERIVALIHRLGEMRRAVAVAEKKLAANVSIPMRAPSQRKARA
jgi:transcriptional regulator with XRE-family HTH domain